VLRRLGSPGGAGVGRRFALLALSGAGPSARGRTRGPRAPPTGSWGAGDQPLPVRDHRLTIVPASAFLSTRRAARGFPRESAHDRRKPTATGLGEQAGRRAPRPTRRRGLGGMADERERLVHLQDWPPAAVRPAPCRRSRQKREAPLVLARGHGEQPEKRSAGQRSTDGQPARDRTHRVAGQITRSRAAMSGSSPTSGSARVPCPATARRGSSPGRPRRAAGTDTSPAVRRERGEAVAPSSSAARCSAAARSGRSRPGSRCASQTSTMAKKACPSTCRKTSGSVWMKVRPARGAARNTCPSGSAQRVRGPGPALLFFPPSVGKGRGWGRAK